MHEANTFKNTPLSNPIHLFLALRRLGWTLVLFTYTDFKTIVFPTLFACVAAPVQSIGRFLHGSFWVWLHLLQVDVSNQYKSVAEDSLNRPQHPVPDGRISIKSAALMRWLLVPLCILSSAPFAPPRFGGSISIASLSLTTLLILHDEVGLAKHWLGKIFINTFGYLSFEIGATTIMNTNSHLDHIALQSIICSAFLIFTTIHAQDFSDVAGDSVQGRVTLPIYAPKASRIFTLFALILWSTALGWLWNVGPITQLLLSGLGALVGCRFVWFCGTATDDAYTFIVYNLWLLLIHILPAQARWRVFSL
ncbi:hypothetical protein C8J57DRAFT_1194212 [Mycena rebaudengoi]|nr:hypothetical protein C8J57DRAFT_1194212 [Mycena rebaudengoi]